MEFIEARYSGRPHIETYGNGGFRFTGGSHAGSLLLLPDNVMAWEIAEYRAANSECFSAVLECPQKIELFIFGSGARLIFPGKAVRDLFKARNIRLECMNTGSACRTYNVLLSENRNVAAGLIAVE